MDEQAPANVLVVGNFSGKTGDDRADVAQQPIRNMFNVDADGIDAAIRRIEPSLSLRVRDQRLDLSFSCLEQFHPDSLFASKSIFSVISELKQSLKNPATAPASAQICRELLGLPASGDCAPAADAEAELSAAESSDDLFSRLLGQAPTRSEAVDPAVKSAVQRILDDAASDGAVAAESPEIAALRDGLDDMLTSAMRELLHNREFQGLEATWRSLQWLQEQLEFGEELSLWLVDVANAEVEDWAPQLQHRVVQTLDRVDLLVVLGEFSDTEESLQQLEALAAAAEALETRAVTGAAPSLAGVAGRPESALALDGSDIVDAESDAWQALRSRSSATHTLLGFPRLILRQPYGRRSDPIDTLEFEELETNPDHECFLWASPAIALGAMLLQGSLQLEDQPMVVYDDGGGQAIKPSSEVYLTDSAGEKLLQRGIVPLMSRRGHTDVRTMRLQSIARLAPVF